MKIKTALLVAFVSIPILIATFYSGAAYQVRAEQNPDFATREISRGKDFAKFFNSKVEDRGSQSYVKFEVSADSQAGRFLRHPFSEICIGKDVYLTSGSWLNFSSSRDGGMVGRKADGYDVQVFEATLVNVRDAKQQAWISYSYFKGNFYGICQVVTASFLYDRDAQTTQYYMNKAFDSDDSRESWRNKHLADEIAKRRAERAKYGVQNPEPATEQTIKNAIIHDMKIPAALIADVAKMHQAGTLTREKLRKMMGGYPDYLCLDRPSLGEQTEKQVREFEFTGSAPKRSLDELVKILVAGNYPRIVTDKNLKIYLSKQYKDSGLVALGRISIRAPGQMVADFVNFTARRYKGKWVLCEINCIRNMIALKLTKTVNWGKPNEYYIRQCGLYDRKINKLAPVKKQQPAKEK